MTNWLRHLALYVTVCLGLVVVWVLTTDSPTGLDEIVADPTIAVDAEFWPVWPIVFWGLLVVFQLLLLPSSIARRRRKRNRRSRRTALPDAPHSIAPLPPDPMPPAMPAPPQPAAMPLHRSLADDALRAAMVGAERLLREKILQPRDRQAAEPRSRFVTVVFTDVVGSTGLNETLGDAAYAAMLREHRALVRAVMADRPGDEINTQGDGFLLAFDAPFDAVAAACAIAHALEDERRTGAFVPSLRIGIHAGDAIDEGDDLIGAVLNTASRICSAADADEILVSEPVAERVAGRVTLIDRGLVPLRGVGQAKHLFAVDWDDRHASVEEVDQR